MFDKLHDDDREIAGIYGPNEAWKITVGKTVGVDKIEVYMEAGPLGYTPWFKIWRRGRLSSRVNAIFVESVVYKGEEI